MSNPIDLLQKYKLFYTSLYENLTRFNDEELKRLV